MPRIIGWWPQDEVPTPPAAFAPDEEYDVGLTLRTLVAGLLAGALGFVSPLAPAWPQDEVPSPAAALVEDDAWQPVRVAEVPPSLWSVFDEDAPAGALHGPPEDDAWRPWWVPPETVPQQALAVEDELPPGPREVDAWLPWWPRPESASRPPVAVEDDLPIAAAPPAVDEDAWWPRESRTDAIDRSLWQRLGRGDDDAYVLAQALSPSRKVRATAGGTRTLAAVRPTPLALEARLSPTLPLDAVRPPTVGLEGKQS